MTAQNLKQPAPLSAYYDGCLYCGLSVMQRRVNRLAEEAFAPLGISPSHASVIMALAEHGEMPSGVLAEMLGLAPSTITRFLDKLEDRALVTRRVEGRLAFASISPAGRETLTDLQEGWRQLYYAYSDVYGRDFAADLTARIAGANRDAGG